MIRMSSAMAESGEAGRPGGLVDWVIGGFEDWVIGFNLSEKTVCMHFSKLFVNGFRLRTGTIFLIMSFLCLVEFSKVPSR